MKDLNNSVRSLENENEVLREELDNLMNQDFVKNFKDEKYSKEIRMVYFDLLSMNISVRNCEKVIPSVLERLGNIEVGSLPSKSVASRMMVEARILSQRQWLRATKIFCTLMEQSSTLKNLDPFKL